VTTANDNSSLPLLLTLSGAVLLVAVGGWFLLETDAPVSPAFEETTNEVSEPGIAETTSPDDAATENPPVESPTIDVDTQLRKARLAVAAEILIFPREQSALHYYNSALAADPQNVVANAELDAMLAAVGQTVSEYLAAGEYLRAYEIASLVAQTRPEHPMVASTRKAIDSFREQLIEEALQQAQDGNDNDATEILKTAQALPENRSNRFSAVRESLAEIKRVRLAAEQDKRERARMAANEAKAAWVNRIEVAIAQGDLITPAGSSAKDLLAERNSWREERSALTSKLIASLLSATRAELDSGQPAAAEKLLDTAAELNEQPGQFEDLRLELENAFIEAESNRLLRLEELAAIKTEAPKYPRQAQLRGQSGWVVVGFTVSPSGETTDIHIIDANPKSIFDDAVMDAVKQWRFKPREYRGKRISQKAATRLGFRLPD
jgi:TonB family protein